MASKYSWECRSCRSVTDFRGKYENNSRVYYSVDQFGNPDMGFKRYPTSFDVRTFRIEMERLLSKQISQQMSRFGQCPLVLFQLASLLVAVACCWWESIEMGAAHSDWLF